MIVGLIIGKHMSMGFPGKNVIPLLGRPMVEYAFIAAKNSKYIESTFVSTDSPDISAIAQREGATLIERPAKLATSAALTEDTLVHAHGEMKSHVGNEIEIIVLLFANAPSIPPGMIDRGIETLLGDPTLDSAFSVCKYEMWSPLRARRIDDNGLIQPFVPLEYFGDPSEMSSIRGGEGACYFCDLAVQVLRERCLTDIWDGQLPFRWMGNRSYALINDYGFDVDFEWQIPVIEHWLKEHGFSEDRTPYEEDS